MTRTWSIKRSLIAFSVLPMLFCASAAYPDKHHLTIDQLTEAAQKGDAVAQTKLGMAYHKGQIVAKDDTAAAKWFQLAADKGNAKAQEELGKLYNTGSGVAKDEHIAASWFYKSAAQGEPHALRELGLAYCLGKGVPVNETEGIRILQMASDRGDAALKQKLAAILASGKCSAAAAQ